MKLISCLVLFFLIQMYNAKQSLRPNHYIRLPWGKFGQKSFHSKIEGQGMDGTNVEIGTGSTKQKFRLKLDTASFDLWVFSKAFDTCDSNYPVVKNKHLYNENVSSTHVFMKDPNPKLIEHDDDWVFGYKSKDLISLYRATVNRTIIRVTKSSKSIANSKFDGSLGLQYHYENGNIITSICDQLKGLRKMFSFYYPRIRTDDDLDNAQLTICGYDEDKYIHDTLKYVSESEPGYWKISAESIQASDTRGPFKLSSRITVIIDTGSNRITAPDTQIQMFYDLIKPYILGDPSKEFGCDTVHTFPKLTFTMEGNEFTLQGPDYTREIQVGNKTTCKLLLQEGTPEHWSLGDPFIRKYFTVFDMERNRIWFAESKG